MEKEKEIKEELEKNKDDKSDEKSEGTEELKLEEKENGKKENKNKKKKKKKKKSNIILEEETEEDKAIKEIMGFNKFSSTKGKSHKDSDVSAVFLGKKAKRIYQRFMNYKPFSKILKQAYMSLNQEF